MYFDNVITFLYNNFGTKGMTIYEQLGFLAERLPDDDPSALVLKLFYNYAINFKRKCDKIEAFVDTPSLLFFQSWSNFIAEYESELSKIKPVGQEFRNYLIECSDLYKLDLGDQAIDSTAHAVNTVAQQLIVQHELFRHIDLTHPYDFGDVLTFFGDELPIFNSSLFSVDDNIFRLTYITNNMEQEYNAYSELFNRALPTYSLPVDSASRLDMLNFFLGRHPILSEQTSPHNCAIYFSNLMKGYWETILKELPDIITCYHNCSQVKEKSVITNGIFHSPLATLTLDVNAAILQAYKYHNSPRNEPCSVLMWEIPKEELFFVCYDDMGPGFLPTKKISAEQVPKNVLEIIKPDIQNHKEVYWVEPRFFREVVYTSREGKV
jgi:hypothetical protein